MASSTVLVVESETDAARVTLLYPTVDVAVLPAGARRFTDGFAGQLQPYALVLVGLDADAAGDAGAAKIMAAVPQAVRFLPGTANDWAAVNGDAPPLPTPPDAAGGIVFESLAQLLDGGVPDPEILVDDLLYADGQVHLVSGQPGHGKTTMVQHMAWMAMSNDFHVVWLDYEGGPKQTVRRLLALGVPGELLRDRFHYASWPPDAEKHLTAVAARFPRALVVIDSFSKALSFAGVNENANDEVTAWTMPVVKACKDHSMSVVIIDHVSKAGKDSDYSRGAGAKLSDSDVHWRVEKTADFNRERIGAITLKLKKDREACLPFASYWTIGDGAGNLTIGVADSPPDPNDPKAPAI